MVGRLQTMRPVAQYVAVVVAGLHGWMAAAGGGSVIERGPSGLRAAACCVDASPGVVFGGNIAQSVVNDSGALARAAESAAVG